MKLQAIILTFCLGFLAPNAVFAEADATEKDRDRLEELFVWKASETLKLPPEQEQKFAQAIRDLNTRKKQANEKMEKAIAQLAAAKSKSNADKALGNYRGVLKDYHSLQFAEVDQLRALLGPEKLARYFVVKAELSEQLKALLSGPRATEKTPPSSTPKIIEEK